MNPARSDATTDRERLKNQIQYLAGVHEPAAPNQQVEKYLRRELNHSDPEGFLSRLEREGEIYSPRPGFWKVTNA